MSDTRNTAETGPERTARSSVERREEAERAASSPHVLILGAGVMQFPALRAAREMGWRVSVADADEGAPGIPLADGFIHVDLADVEGMISAAAQLQERIGLDGVFTAGTDFSYTVARVARELGLPGTDPEAALRASDKVRMRESFRTAGVPSPRFVAYTALPGDFSEGASAELERSGIAFPVVVKPVDNMGARGVRRADTAGEFEAALRAALEDSRSGRAIAEEFVPGQEFSLDGIVEGGEVTVCGFADRHIRFSPYFVEMGHTMPSSADPQVRSRVTETFARAVAALGIRDGQAKGDIKWTGETAVAGEVAARLSGGYMSGWTYPYASGVNLTAAALRQAVGLDPGDLRPRKHHTTAERAFISIPGRVERIEGFDRAREREHIREAFTRISEGSEVRFPRNNVEKCGNFIAEAPGADRACGAAEAACREVFVRLTPGDPRTFSFLFREEGEWPPAAFPLRSRRNRQCLAGMPLLHLPSERLRSGGAGASEEHGGSWETVDTDGGQGQPESREPALRLAVLGLPEREDGCDWHGFDWSTALEEVTQRSRGTVEFVSPEAVPPAESCVLLGSLFWRAFLRGGIQGAVWTIETLRREIERGEVSTRWEELR